MSDVITTARPDRAKVLVHALGFVARLDSLRRQGRTMDELDRAHLQACEELLVDCSSRALLRGCLDWVAAGRVSPHWPPAEILALVDSTSAGQSAGGSPR